MTRKEVMQRCIDGEVPAAGGAASGGVGVDCVRPGPTVAGAGAEEVCLGAGRQPLVPGVLGVHPRQVVDKGAVRQEQLGVAAAGGGVDVPLHGGLRADQGVQGPGRGGKEQ